MKFIEATVQPLKDLCEDIGYHLEENRDQILLGVHNNSNDNISNAIASVKEQQCNIMEQLEVERVRLEAELDECVQMCSANVVQHLPEIKIGPPGKRPSTKYYFM